MRKQKKSTGWSYIVVLLLTFIFISTSIYMDHKNKAYANENLMEVQVEAGDTIWELSIIYKEYHDLTHQEFIKKVENLNQIDADQLEVGQSIILPITNEG
jgi:hypothetical protein